MRKTKIVGYTEGQRHIERFRRRESESNKHSDRGKRSPKVTERRGQDVKEKEDNREKRKTKREREMSEREESCST